MEQQAKDFASEFERTFGRWFDSVEVSVVPPRGNYDEAHALISARAKKAGWVCVRYWFDTLDGGGRGSREFHLYVVPEGEGRATPEDACVGDTVVFPVPLTYVKNHRFTSEQRYQFDAHPRQPGGEKGLVLPAGQPEVLAPELSFAGTVAGTMLMRSLQLSHSVTGFFRAERPGRFTLHFNPSTGPAAPEWHQLAIVILPRGGPIRLVARQATGWVDRHDGYGGGSDTRGYPVRTLVLRPGDYFTVPLARAVKSDPTPPLADFTVRRTPFDASPYVADPYLCDRWLRLDTVCLDTTGGL